MQACFCGRRSGLRTGATLCILFGTYGAPWQGTAKCQKASHEPSWVIFYDVYGRYSGEYNGIKIAATTGWGNSNIAGVLEGNPFPIGGSPGQVVLPAGRTHSNAGYWQSGVYVEHVPTGLFVYGAYGREFWSDVAAGFNSQPDHWMVKAGVRERWHPLGHTVLYGSYAQRNDMYDEDVVDDALFAAGVIGANGVTTGSETREWAIGVVQEIDAAAMSMWLQYDHITGSTSGCGAGVGGFNVAGAAGTCFNPGSISFDANQVLKFGALINF